MNDTPLYENLDTAFVDLDALVRYVRRRNFVGKISVTYTGYAAEILFTPEGKLRVSEHDKISGVHADGKSAFSRILERCKVAGGIVSVSQELGEKLDGTNDALPPPVSFVANAAALSPKKNGKSRPAKAGNGEVKLSEFPSTLSDEVAGKARQAREKGVEFDMLVKLTSELLGEVDQSLAKADLHFQAAFAKACGEISDDFPFMDPARKEFEYSDGTVRVHVDQDPQALVSGVGEALRRIFARLNSTPRLGKVHRFAAQRVRALGRERRDLYEKYDLLPQIEIVLQA